MGKNNRKLRLPYFTPCSSVSIVHFEHANADWKWLWCCSSLLLKEYIQTHASTDLLMQGRDLVGSARRISGIVES